MNHATLNINSNLYYNLKLQLGICWTRVQHYDSTVNSGNTKGDQFDPLCFFEFSPYSPGLFFLEASICDRLMLGSMLRVNPTQSYGENTKSPIHNVHRFRYKNLLQFIF